MIATASHDNVADAAQPSDSVELAGALCAAKPAAGPLGCPPRHDELSDDYLARLLDQEHDADAVRFTAMRLGPQAAAWWGALAVWNALRSQEPATNAAANAANAAIDATVRWVLEPTEPHRQEAKHAGEAAGIATAAGALATAVYWSGGSISLPDQPFVPPSAGVLEKLVANAILMAATPSKPGTVARPFLPALRVGAEVLTGANRWPDTAVEATTQHPATTGPEP